MIGLDGMVEVNGQFFPSLEAAEDVGFNVNGSKKSIGKRSLGSDSLSEMFERSYEVLDKVAEFLNSEYFSRHSNFNSKDLNQVFSRLGEMGYPVKNYTKLDREEKIEYLGEIVKSPFSSRI